MGELVSRERMALSDLWGTPERGRRFTDNLCEDCRKIVRSE